MSGIELDEDLGESDVEEAMKPAAKQITPPKKMEEAPEAPA